MIARFRGPTLESDAVTALALSLVISLAAVAVGVPALTGPALAQSGSVSLQNDIFEDTDPITVDIPQLDGIQEGYLEVENLDNGNTEVYQATVTQGETESVHLSSIGASSAGDRIQARLYETTDKQTELDRDTTRVSGFTGSFSQSIYTVPQGQTAQMDATISNPGDVEATETVELYIYGTDGVIGSRTVTVGPGSSTQVTFTWNTSGYDVMAYDAELRSRYDGEILDLATVDVQVPDPPNFQVQIDSTNSPVTEGQALDVTATVTNTGDESDSQDVNLYVGDFQHDSTTLALAGGESATVTLSWQTKTGDAGEYDAVVASNNDSAVSSVLVEEPAPANFDVQLHSTNSPVTEGGALDVTATVTNTGEQSGSQDIELYVGDFQRDSTTLTLGGGESTTVTFSWRTESGDAGEYAATVASDNSSATTSVLVEEPPPATYDVQFDSTNSPVTEGQAIDVRATIWNKGGDSGSQEVTLRIQGIRVDSKHVSLVPGETTSVALTWATAPGDAGDYVATVASENTTASRDVRVEEALGPAYFDVEFDFTSSPVMEGESLLVVGTVRNTGEENGTQTVTLDVDGSEVDATEVSAAGGESTQVTLEWQTGAGDAGNHTVTIASADDSADAPVRVQTGATTNEPGGTEESPDRPRFDVRIDATNSPVTEGQALDVEVTITNRGDGDASDDVVLRLGGDRRDARSISLGGGDSTTLSLTWETGSGDAGEHIAVVESTSGAAEEPVVVEKSDGGSFDVEIESATAPEDEDDPLLVTATITNAGSSADTQVVTVAVDGDERASKRLSLGPGESRNVSFSWEPSSDSSEPTIEVWSEDDEDRSALEAPTSGGGNPLTDPLLVGLLLLLLAALGGGYYYVRRQQLNDEGSD